jgi:alpha-galactosidase
VRLRRHHHTIAAAEGARLELRVDVTEGGFTWSVTNRGSWPATVRSVAVVHSLDATDGELRMFRNGYQSWSQTNTVVPGVDVDPSSLGTVEMVTMMHHADQRSTIPEQLRSELVTVLADAGDAVLIGFLGGDRHDGTIRIGQGLSGTEVAVEAFLGSAELAPGETRELHEVVLRHTTDPVAALDDWASECGARAGARTDAGFQVGWCSWYHYFDRVTEADLRANLAAADGWPFDVVQLDDGYQSQVGDWLTTNDKFPSGLAGVAQAITSAGYRAGLWLAPFGVAANSVLAAEHPDWLVLHPDGDPLISMYGEHWGGFVHTLDVTRPEVLVHLEQLARDLVALGFSYLKLDFTYSPGFDAQWHDRSLTPAQRVRAGYDAIRRGAGDDTFILGCGAPQGACIGVVDGMRIGPDVAPFWHPRPDEWGFHGYELTIPSTSNGWRSTLTRSFEHRRLWLNDPDCVMLRSTDTELTPDQVRAWALAVGVSGGMVLVSDDLAVLDEPARALLDEVIALGRRSDDGSRTGSAPRCEDLLTAATPTRLRSAAGTLVGDVEIGRATVEAD